MKSKFNYRRISEKIAKSQRGFNIINNRIQRKFDAEKEVFIQEFESHPVSQEIIAGEANPEANHNPSATLGGVGNLFSSGCHQFIG